MKLAFVTPRYGAAFLGSRHRVAGSCANRSASGMAVDVLTTCARATRAWKHEYSEGSDRVRGVLGDALPSTRRCDAEAFEHCRRGCSRAHSRGDEQDWIRRLWPSRRRSRLPEAAAPLVRCRRVLLPLQHATTVHGIAAAARGEASSFRTCGSIRPSIRHPGTRCLDRPGASVYLSPPRRLNPGFPPAVPGDRGDRGCGCRDARAAGLSAGTSRTRRTPSRTTTRTGPHRRRRRQRRVLARRGIPFRRRHRLYGSLRCMAARVEQDNGFEESWSTSTASPPHATTGLVLMGLKLMEGPGRAVHPHAGHCSLPVSG